MSFTTDVKKEIISRSGGMGAAEKKSALSAFIRTSGSLGFSEGQPTFFIVSETESVAEFFTSLFFDVFHAELAVSRATQDRLSGRDKLVLQCPVAESKRVLQELGLLRKKGDGFPTWIASSLVEEENATIAYIRGAFLGSGSCSLPHERSGYHLEIVFTEKGIADDFCALLGDFSLFAKVVERKDDFVAYIKSKEAISDFLAVVGARNALKKFSALALKRDKANHDNRAANCQASNADKTAQASVKQVIAFQRLQTSPLWEELPDELKQTAIFRMENPVMTLKEWSEKTGLSKSCINHRIRKLMELAGTIQPQ